jgi:type II secretory pathway component PulC
MTLSFIAWWGCTSAPEPAAPVPPEVPAVAPAEPAVPAGTGTEAPVAPVTPPVAPIQVDRKVWEHSLQNLEEMSTMARVVPHTSPAGKVEGFRLMGIRSGTLPDQLGLQNGDIVRSVAGVELSTVEAALKIYADLQTREDFCISLVRQAEPLEQCYRMR